MRKGATLRYKAISKGKIESLYLQYYPPLTGKDGKTCWYEFLHMERYKSPENDVERRYNHDVEELAEAIRCERYLMLVRKDYPFSCYTGLPEGRQHAHHHKENESGSPAPLVKQGNEDYWQSQAERPHLPKSDGLHP